jgi:hypothetical protein
MKNKYHCGGFDQQYRRNSTYVVNAGSEADQRRKEHKQQRNQ